MRFVLLSTSYAQQVYFIVQELICRTGKVQPTRQV